MPKKQAAKRVGVRAYARHRGCSHVTVLRAIEDGRITRDAAGKIDVGAADADWLRNSTQSGTQIGTAGTPEPPDPGDVEPPLNDEPGTVSEGRAALLFWQAKEARRVYLERAGQTYDAETVELRGGELADRLMGAILAMPVRYAPELERLGVPAAEAERVLERIGEYLVQALRDLTEDFGSGRAA